MILNATLFGIDRVLYFCISFESRQFFKRIFF